MATVATLPRELMEPEQAEVGDPRPPAPPLLPLENGDHLSRLEFERRFDAMPHLKKAELIDGVVFMASPVNHENHGEPHFNAAGWLNLYRYATPGVRGGDNSSIRLDLDNMPQPDAFLYVDPARGGQVRIAEDGYVEAAPDFVMEVASSSVSYDLNAKFHSYRRMGVKEYVVWRTLDRDVDWFVLRDGRYVRLDPGADGIYRSEAMPGLWLSPSALIGDDRPEILRVNALGTASPEHATFVARIQAAVAPPNPPGA